MINLTESDFNTQVHNTKGVAVVQLSAVWCGPCRFLGPVLTELESEGAFTYFKVDVDENPGLARDFNVMSIPTMLIYKDGQLEKTLVGMKPKKAIQEELNKL